MTKSEREMRAVRGRKISMILQDPQTSLNPVFTIGDQIIEALRVASPGATRSAAAAGRGGAAHGAASPRPSERLRDYPAPDERRDEAARRRRDRHRLRAASCSSPTSRRPRSTSTIQLQYLKLLKEMQARTGSAMLFITHDFGIVARMCDRVAVMYAGRIVESGPVRELFKRPRHPYTQALLASVPRMEARVERLPSIEGQPPALHAPAARAAGSPPRCPYAEERCRDEYPPTFAVGPAHEAACWRAEPRDDRRRAADRRSRTSA